MWRLNNKPGSQKPIMIALLAVASVLVILVVVDMFTKPKVQVPVNNNPVATNTDVQAPANVSDVVAMPQGQKDQFKADVPTDIVVPDVNTKLTDAQKKEIAIPTVVTPAAPGVTAQFRNFKISAENDAYVPSKIIVNAGDTVHVDFTAVDKAYDIVFPSYNMMQTAQKGETKILEFQASEPGSFTYYCSSCGGPDKGPTGQFIIVPKS